MYTIKQAAARSGVTVQLLRAWERRYHVVEPTRTASGYRLYDDSSIGRLRAMRGLIDSGWAPSTAAAHIRDLDDAAIEQMLAQEADSSADGATGGRRDVAATKLADAFVTSAAALDEPGFERVLDEMFSRGTFEQVTTELVMPALVALGDGWAAGTLDVAAEHAASGAVRRRLDVAFLAAGVARDEDIVLVGLPPGAQHDLGALAFATAARRAGITVRYLGADLPVSDWLDVVARTNARAVVIGAVIGRDVKPAAQVARAIRDSHPGVLIAFGGRAAHSVPTAGLERVLVLPQDLPQSIETLQNELAFAA